MIQCKKGLVTLKFTGKKKTSFHYKYLPFVDLALPVINISIAAITLVTFNESTTSNIFFII